jgi:cytochrome c-type biogenesis protein CcmH
MIYLVFALLTGVAVMAVLAPLGFGGGATERGSPDADFFKEQIAEIEREVAAGRLDPAEAEAAKTEAARRLLRAHEAGEAAGEAVGDAAPSRKRALIAALAAFVLVPAIALGLYLKIGAAALPDMPLDARLAAPPQPTDLAGAVARVEAHLREHPDDGRGFEVVAPYYLRSGRVEDAIHAYGEAQRLLGPTALRHAALGEARVFATQGRVGKDAEHDFEQALTLEPKLAIARYYLGVAAEQNNDKDKAIAIWDGLLADAPAGAPYIKVVRAKLDALRGVSTPPEASAPDPESARGPDSTQGKAIAAMPRGNQQAMIHTMVERLASRLATKGDDVEGWLKLLRAYSVLGEQGKAAQALADARRALARRPAELSRIDALARDLNIGG